ncbi:MAG: hypothetical protein UR69_C0001G0091 [Candidatus Moranbacteria bacterium GW2011_GWE2_35_2-]|nr:MAG: hypothetical protein UR69_C0001G0091 [Candidatus Moranbacteria bacterium GW2011_GWE2_35_2-]KKQ22911.1 MAG: hypothetical protein US37_C0001G0183 [Candidatus Moranbacteria bacterium GW2011_GWF2_37_11]KKQ29269.1 MAG: hypothetical protein US44_C0002G0051 [Candidatus Moranbacteria bacterium GW2011_GWD1_37_17]KKQ30858.1 MAG: hypothetical protein US47_C0001G0091 [Candidatus Moranbacteria bacterium GW2011_GWE1_37_24]KKQ47295.1 MAG: hypothetical protein US66_C0014G0009 [Candidatus Moranbacteria 
MKICFICNSDNNTADEVVSVVKKCAGDFPEAYSVEDADVIFYFSPKDMRDNYPPLVRGRKRRLILISSLGALHCRFNGGSIVEINLGDDDAEQQIVACIEEMQNSM